MDAYREEADRFCAALDEELYLHFAGHKEQLELAAVYERFADVTSLDACRRLGEAAKDADNGIRELWRFACEGYLGDLTRDHADRIATVEATLEATVDGETVPFRLLRPSIANEPDRDRRARLEEARVELQEEELNPIYAEALDRTREGARMLGAETYRGLYERFGIPLEELRAGCERLLAETEDLYLGVADRLFRDRLGLALEEATRPDVLRLLRATTWDDGFPADAMLPALEGTLSGLGIDLRSQRNVELDVEPRPLKSPRAFCAPIEVPGRVVLVIQPMGGPDDWHALFHEAGHTEHYAAKLLYELELHGGADLESARPRYAELMEEATKIPPSDADFLADVDPGFYAQSYLRSWAFEAQMSLFLREEFGSAWFARREAGSLLRELWAEGQRLTADELLAELDGSRLDLEAIVDRTKEPLRV